ncbi:hypothetical protein MIR68_009342 [Amoeboaphelidium protococcarum]|nr:hypothetical protein MIR68_009342 [Amoeboaphelidium protococcarum]
MMKMGVFQLMLLMLCVINSIQSSFQIQETCAVSKNNLKRTADGSERPNQDNRLTFQLYVGDISVQVVGIFDGHGDRGHVITELIKRDLQTWMKKLSDIPEMSAAIQSGDVDKIKRVISKIVLALDHILCSKINYWSLAYKNGSTMTLAVLIGDDIFFAHLGDSLYVFGENYEHGVNILSTNFESLHQPNTMPDEQERITSKGGYIQQGYIGFPGERSLLAMTRALGDCGLKTNKDIGHYVQIKQALYDHKARLGQDQTSQNRDHDHELVSQGYDSHGVASAKPHIEHVKLESKKRYALFMSTDGLYADAELKDVIIGMEKEEARRDSCNKLIQNFRRRSTDDTTVLLFDIQRSEGYWT